MDIELSSVIDAPMQKLWDTLLDPNRMARCVPGVVSVEIVSDREYVVQLQVRIAFIAARFKVRTTITELTPPNYLRCESSGEDSSIGSSVKSTSEMFLTAIDDGRSQLRVSTRATVLGKLGALGLNPMRTKAERMWEEFCRNLEAEIAGKPIAAAQVDAPTEAAKAPADNAVAPRETVPTDTGSWSRSSAKPGLMARFRGALGGREDVFIELRRNDTTVALHLPGSRTGEALAWLDRQLGVPGKS